MITLGSSMMRPQGLIRGAIKGRGNARFGWEQGRRASALTEAREAGVLVDDLMPAATHKERRTTLGYVRNDLPATQRVARARFSDQNKP